MWWKAVGVTDLLVSDLLWTQIEFASSVGQPLKLVMSPSTTILSRKFIEKYKGGGGVFRYDPISRELTKFERL